MRKSIYKEERKKIIEAARTVHRILGPGFIERIYHDALEHELQLQNIFYEREAELIVKYKDMIIPTYCYADFMCFEKIIVEVLAVRRLTREHKWELANFLKATGYRAGLLLNFGRRSLQVTKKTR
jgi:GxxExxY protein